MSLRAILFDKDGCLCDFGATWDGWAAQMLDRLAQGDVARRQALADALQFDLGKGQFRPESPIISGTYAETAQAMAGALNDPDVAGLEGRLLTEAERVSLVEVVPLGPLLSGLAARGYALAVVTNDAELLARGQLAGVQAAGYFQAITGADSGFGAKPDPGPLLATAQALGVPPGACLMVGDSLTDLIAAQAAGMRSIGVLTGHASRETLAAYATDVLPDIGHLPDWLHANR